MQSHYLKRVVHDRSDDYIKLIKNNNPPSPTNMINIMEDFGVRSILINNDWEIAHTGVGDAKEGMPTEMLHILVQRPTFLYYAKLDAHSWFASLGNEELKSYIEAKIPQILQVVKVYKKNKQVINKVFLVRAPPNNNRKLHSPLIKYIKILSSLSPLAVTSYFFSYLLFLGTYYV